MCIFSCFLDLLDGIKYLVRCSWQKKVGRRGIEWREKEKATKMFRLESFPADYDSREFFSVSGMNFPSEALN